MKKFQIMINMNGIITIWVNITTIQNRIITIEIILTKETITPMRIMRIQSTINQKKNKLSRTIIIIIIIMKIDISPTTIIIETIIRTTLSQKI